MSGDAAEAAPTAEGGGEKPSEAADAAERGGEVTTSAQASDSKAPDDDDDDHHHHHEAARVESKVAPPAAPVARPLVPGAPPPPAPEAQTQQPILVARAYPSSPPLVVVPSYDLPVWRYRCVPPGADPGGFWVRLRYCGPWSWLCGVTWCILFWPIACFIAVFKCDDADVYVAPNGKRCLRDGSTPPPDQRCC